MAVARAVMFLYCLELRPWGGPKRDGFLEAATDLRTDMAGNLKNTYINGKGTSFEPNQTSILGVQSFFPGLVSCI